MEVWDIFRDCKSGIDFENTVVKFLRCLAFEANRTGKDDGGIDIVATTSVLSTKYTFYIHLIHLWGSARSKRFMLVQIIMVAAENP